MGRHILSFHSGSWMAIKLEDGDVVGQAGVHVVSDHEDGLVSVESPVVG